jgi:hypothetical protein
VLDLIVRRRRKTLRLPRPEQGQETPRSDSARIRRSIEKIRDEDNSLPTPSDLDKPFLGELVDSSPSPLSDAAPPGSSSDHLREENRNLKRLQEAIHFLGSTEDLNALVPEIVGLGTSLSGLTRGLLVLLGGKQKSGEKAFKVRVVRGISRDERSTPEVRILRKILAKTLEERRAIFEADARTTDFARGVPEADHLVLGSVCSLPLEAEGELLGALLLDEPPRHTEFDKTERELLKSFARHAALALARLSDRTRLKQRTERLRNEREELRSTLEETQHELKTLRVESGRLKAKSSRLAAIASTDDRLDEFLGRSFQVAKRGFLRHYLTEAIEKANGDLERASRATGLGVAKLVKLLEIYEVKPPRNSGVLRSFGSHGSR